MKFTIFFVMILFFSVNSFSQTPTNIQYEQTLDRCVKYEATLLTHNNKLYVDAKGGIEEYQILADGSLEQLSYISTFHYSIANAIILGDSLFVATEMNNSSKILVIDISSSPMQLVETLNTNSQYGIFKLAGNYNYFMYTPSSSSYSLVYNRQTLEFIDQLLTGGYYSVHDDYLFYQTTINDSTYLNISDIQDLDNIIELSSLNIGMNEQNIGYFFYDDLLFISQNTQIVIINISDIYNPFIVSTISDISSVPSVNFFTTLLRYNDYLVFGNTETKFWIYDISNLSSPQFISVDNQFVGGSSYKNSLILNEDNIYYSRSDRNICVLYANDLPNLNIVDEFGSQGQFHFSNFTYPYILYSNPIQQKQFYININTTNPEPVCLAETPWGWVSPVCYNDSLICFIITEYSAINLVICNYNDVSISVVNTIPLGTFNYNYVFFRGDFLILTGDTPGSVSINTINPDFTISEVGYFEVGEDACVIEQTTQCNDDYLYIQSEYNGTDMIDIYENQIPFDQVCNFELNYNNHSFDTMKLLENNRVLLCEYLYPGGTYYLCDYTFPNTFVQLDSYTTSEATFSLHDNFLYWSKAYDGLAKFYTWQNDELESIQTHNFDIEINDVFFDEEDSKFYAIGRYNIQEYSCDYVSVDDHQIPVFNVQLSNHPNPFNPSTEIRFQLSDIGKQQTVVLSIYNIKGQKVRQLVRDQLSAGQHSIIWDGENSNNQSVSTGVYFYQLELDGKPIASRKCLMLK
jgi:FlgD Ig-like domain